MNEYAVPASIARPIGLRNLEAIHAWLAGDDSKISPEELKNYQAIIFSPEADEIHSIAATELGATA